MMNVRAFLDIDPDYSYKQYKRGELKEEEQDDDDKIVTMHFQKMG
jgi:hypothetical protein